MHDNAGRIGDVAVPITVAPSKRLVNKTLVPPVPAIQPRLTKPSLNMIVL